MKGKNSQKDGNTRTFQEASAQIQANLQRHIERQKSDGLAVESDEDSDGSEKEEAGSSPSAILDQMFKSYGMDTGDSRTRSAVIQSLSSGANACLICISSIKKLDPIWNCTNCFCSLHMSCVQRWARDSLFQLRQDRELHREQQPRHAQGAVKDEAVQWCCPNCREEFAERAIPNRYTCFCGKLVEPPHDPWITPHSCGETCHRSLRPPCGHDCLILCHPGPCPPCPKMVTARCFCGHTAPATRRCFDKDWSCGKPCGNTLNCGKHACPVPCHEGPCAPCGKTAVQLCQCQRHQRECRCTEPNWQCEEKCGRKLKCGHHVCDIKCHRAKCPLCPLSQVRHCPCGKQTYTLPCTLATPTCGDTCGKVLSCGQHVCVERCHRGACGSCLQMIVKHCRCGTKKREVPCTKEFTCDIKCKRMRDCRKHACNRKCCDESCPSCEQVCGKMLNCKNHKCESRCHTGVCYPCNQTREVACNCGSSRILVACGREKVTHPPKCRQKCQTASDCHHKARSPHNCHFGECPTCRQSCSQGMKCGHICPAPCHDRVKVKVNPEKKAALPWEEVGPRMETKTLNCPDCQVPMSVTCSGGHDTSEFPCFMAKTASCGRKCGRNLDCGNHTCSRDCHRVKHAPSQVDAGTNCRQCELECQMSRPKDCAHPCRDPCHKGDCEACGQMTRIWCHCALLQLYVKCGDWTQSAGLAARETLQSCKNQCPKLMSCGHRCSKTCHSGQCSDSKTCRKKSKFYCKCKRIKIEKSCSSLDGARASEMKIPCDEECHKAKTKPEGEDGQDLDWEERWRKEEEKRLQREELERFEKMKEGKRRKRNRRVQSETVEQGFLAKHKLPLAILTIFVTVMGVVVGVWIMK